MAAIALPKKVLMITMADRLRGLGWSGGKERKHGGDDSGCERVGVVAHHCEHKGVVSSKVWQTKDASAG